MGFIEALRLTFPMFLLCFSNILRNLKIDLKIENDMVAGFTIITFQLDKEENNE